MRTRRIFHTSPRAALTAFVASVTILMAGCNRWAIQEEAESLLQRPKMSPDSVVLEVAIIDIPEGEVWDHEELWQEVDEQQTPAEKRQLLLANGFRCGLLGSRLPEALRTQIAEQQENIELESRDGAAVISNDANQHRLQCRAGRARPVIIGKKDRQITIENTGTESIDANHVDTRGEQAYDAAHCELLVTANPQGDGRVKVSMVPQIRHGEIKQRWVAQDGMFHIDAGRDCEVFDNLTLDCILSPGQTWAMASTVNAIGPGRAFLGENPKSGFVRSVVLVRLAQTQQDDLFSPVSQATPTVIGGQ